MPLFTAVHRWLSITIKKERGGTSCQGQGSMKGSRASRSLQTVRHAVAGGSLPANKKKDKIQATAKNLRLHYTKEDDSKVRV